jgi:hypothetical protein
LQNRRRSQKTTEELEAMILADLRKVDGCPKHGVKVTVYGIPWNAMLRNKNELKGFFEIIVERLKRLYDVTI